jgi:hypothetical protein
MGLTLAIDDFGTGYSSFSYLRQFRVSKLKIDRSFIRDVAVNPDDAAITTAIISMAKSLHLKVIAEGVENEAQMSFLRTHHCDEIQGYYFSKPLAVDKVADKLRGTAVQVLSAKHGAGQGSWASLKSVKVHHTEEGDPQILSKIRAIPEFLNGLGGQNRGCGIESAWLGQWEEPLYEIVNAFLITSQCDADHGTLPSTGSIVTMCGIVSRLSSRLIAFCAFGTLDRRDDHDARGGCKKAKAIRSPDIPFDHQRR